MALLTYSPITFTVEASASDEVDDISVATIRIVASWVGAFPTALTGIVFSVPVSGANRLTGNPKSITPTVKEHGAWLFVEESQANGKFVATRTAPTLGNDSSVTFYLHDIEIVKEEGNSEITVTEEGGAGAVTVLTVRKVPAELRIDFFRAVGPDIPKPPAVRAIGTLPLPPAMKNGQTPAVTLEWQTTAAEQVALIGPDGEFVVRPDGGAAINGAVPDDKDGSVVVNPKTTSTYTLIAKKGNDEKVRAVQQVTVTVTDHTLVSGILDVTGSSDSSIANLSVVSLKVTGKVTGGLNVEGGITGEGSVPVSKVVGGEIQGAILMWSGDTAPVGWEICDGRERKFTIDSIEVTVRTPDLKDKFVLGKGSRALGVNDEGKESVELTDLQIPAHTHAARTTPTDPTGLSGHHGHSSTFPATSVGPSPSGSVGYEPTVRVLLSNPERPSVVVPGGEHEHDVTVFANVTGATAKEREHNNMPPFYVLAFIIRLPAGAVPVP